MGEQIDQLQKLKNKLEKEKQTVKSEFDDLRSQVEHVQKGKAAAEKLAKQLEQQLNDIQAKIEDQARQVTDLSHQKTKLGGENSDLIKQVEESEHQIATLTKAKVTLQQQVDEAKRTLEEETRGKGSASTSLNPLKYVKLKSMLMHQHQIYYRWKISQINDNLDFSFKKMIKITIIIDFGDFQSIINLMLVHDHRFELDIFPPSKKRQIILDHDRIFLQQNRY